MEGNTKTKIISEVTEELLNEIGWEAERIRMHGLFSADVNKFIDAIHEAIKIYESIGHAPARLKMLDKFED